MAIEVGLRNRLVNDTDVNNLVSTRVYPLRLPQGYTLPAISYQRISAERIHEMSIGPIGWAWSRFQVDCWANSYGDVRSLAEAVRQSLDGFKGDLDSTHVGGIYIEGERDLFEENAEIYRVTMDFLIPYKETA